MKTLQEFDNMLETLVVGASVEAQGWDSAIHDLNAAKGDQMFLYFHDTATRWTWMVSVSREGFHAAAKVGRNMSPEKTIELRHVLSSVAIDLANKNIAAGTSKEEKLLGSAMCRYAGGTKTFQAAEGFKDGGHFCAILYRKDRNAEEANLRPFALKAPPDKPVPVDVFMGTVLQVVEIDSARHPEWVNGSY